MIVFEIVTAFCAGGFFGFTLAALIAMSGRISQQEEVVELRRIK